MQRCLPYVILPVDFGLVFEQHLDTPVTRSFRCPVQWCPAPTVRNIWICAAIEEPLHGIGASSV